MYNLHWSENKKVLRHFLNQWKVQSETNSPKTNRDFLLLTPVTCQYLPRVLIGSSFPLLISVSELITFIVVLRNLNTTTTATTAKQTSTARYNSVIYTILGNLFSWTYRTLFLSSKWQYFAVLPSSSVSGKRRSNKRHIGNAKKINNQNYNKILESDWLSTGPIWALIGQCNCTVHIMPV